VIGPGEPLPESETVDPAVAVEGPEMEAVGTLVEGVGAAGAGGIVGFGVGAGGAEGGRGTGEMPPSFLIGTIGAEITLLYPFPDSPTMPNCPAMAGPFTRSFA
jgi:hypothetical protein